MDRKKTAYGYIRVSTEAQVDGASLDTQRSSIEEFAANHDIEIVGWFEDPGFSAKNAKRPGLQKMLKTIDNGEKGGIDYVIVYNMTRASRSMVAYFVDIIAPLRKRGVRLLSTTEDNGDLDDLDGSLAMTLSVLVGEIDNKQKGKTTSENMRNLMVNSGWWMGGGHPPLGMKPQRVSVEGKYNDGHQKTHSILVPDETYGRAEKVATLLTRFSEGDMTKADLLKMAHDMDLRGAKGELLALSTLEHMLQNDLYAGWHASKTLSNKQLVKMKFEGLISLETFEKNQRILKGNPRPHEESDNSLYPLHKTICCAICGAEMTEEGRGSQKLPYLRSSAPTSGSGKRTPRYSCKCKGHGSLLAADAHAIFEDYLRRITPEEGTLRLFREIVKRTAFKQLGNNNNRIKELNRQIEEIISDKQNAIAQLLKHDLGLSDDDKREHLATYDDKRARLEAELEDLKRIQLLNEATIEYVCNFMRMPAKLWRDGNLEVKQAIQHIIFPHGIYFDLKHKKCGTSEISPLFSVIDIKKAPSGANLNDMGWDIGIEPTTFWTTIRRSNQLS